MYLNSRYHSSIKEYGSRKLLFNEISRYSKSWKTAENDLQNNGLNKNKYNNEKTLRGLFFSFF